MTDTESGPDTDSQQVRPANLAAVRSVVIDANIMGRRGDLRVGVLRRLNDISKRDGYLEVLVPESVLWEWQEHATRAYADIARNLTESASHLAQAGLELPTLPLSAEEVRSVVLAAISGFSHVRIVALRPEHALEALRDQVLVLPPGERVAVGNKSIKTGASDSSWIRAIHAEAGGDSSTYVVLTNDKDVAAAYQHWGWKPPLLLPSVNALSMLLEGSLFPELTPDCVSTAVKRLLKENWDEGIVAFDLVDEHGIAKATLDQEEEYLDIELSLDSIVSVAGFSDLSIVDRVSSIQGTLFLIGVVDVTGWRHNAITDQLDANYAGSFRCLLRTPVLLNPADSEPNGLWLSFEDSSVVHPLNYEWTTSEDAFEALLEAIGSIPGCDGLALPDNFVSGEILRYNCLSSRPIEINLDTVDTSEEWTATVSHGDVSLTVSCVLADSNYFGNTWIVRGEVTFHEGNSVQVEDVWSGVSYLLASFVESGSGDVAIGPNT